MKFTLDFGKHDFTDNGIKDNLVEVEVLLQHNTGRCTTITTTATDRLAFGTARPRLSICGTIWNRLKTDCISAGQNLDTIRELVGLRWQPLMKRVHYIWQRYHLNDMKAGTPCQEAYLAGYKDASGESYDYLTRKEILEKAGLEPAINGYCYGTSWLYSPIPDDVIAEIKSWSDLNE